MIVPPGCRKPPYASRTCASHRGHRQEKELDLRTARAEAWSNMSQSALIGPHYVRNYHIMNHIISYQIISYQIISYHTFHYMTLLT